MEIFIPHNVPSLKNSKQWTGKYLVKSKTVQKYLRKHGIKTYSSGKKTVTGYATIDDSFKQYSIAIKEQLINIEPPYKLYFYFIRESKRKFDFGNTVEILADLFTAYDVWEDDNVDYFLPFPYVIDDSVYKVDKLNPGVIIKISQ